MNPLPRYPSAPPVEMPESLSVKDQELARRIIEFSRPLIETDSAARKVPNIREIDTDYGFHPVTVCWIGGCGSCGGGGGNGEGFIIIALVIAALGLFVATIAMAVSTVKRSEKAQEAKNHIQGLQTYPSQDAVLERARVRLIDLLNDKDKKRTAEAVFSAIGTAGLTALCVSAIFGILYFQQYDAFWTTHAQYLAIAGGAATLISILGHSAILISDQANQKERIAKYTEIFNNLGLVNKKLGLIK